MTFGSVCSGIEAASCAWLPLGWRCRWTAEVAPFPSAVLAHRYPDVPNLGDLNGLLTSPPPAVDVLIGGTPCQSFSVAGLRGGLTDARGNLALAFMALAGLLRPRWVVWENVPGVLSSNGGRDFGSILGALGELGYGFAYRVLDAQYFGLAQRRKRVFVVGHLGDWRRAAAVLFEPDRLRRDSPPSRQTRAGVARVVAGGPGVGRRDVDAGGLPEGAEVSALRAFGGNNTSGSIEVATAVRAKGGSGHGDFESETFIAHTLRGTGHDASEDGPGRGAPLVPIAFDARQTDVIVYGDKAGPLDTCAYSQGVALPIPFDTTQITSAANRSAPAPGDPCHPLAATSHVPAIAYPVVRGMMARTQEVERACSQEGRPGPLLRELRGEVGEEAFTEWGLGILDPLRAAEVLRPGVHGGGVQQPSAEVDDLGCEPLPCKEGCPSEPVCALWRCGCPGCPPFGWEPREQLARELGAHLPLMPSESSSTSAILRGLWEAAEGIGVLRYALSAIQEARRPDDGRDPAESEVPGVRQAGAGARFVRAPLHAAQAYRGVRRLTCVEMERLMGFPDDYTAVPWRGRPVEECPDGPRAKALGNSMAVPVIRWIGERIALVDALSCGAP